LFAKVNGNYVLCGVLHSETKFTTKTVGGRLKAVIALGDH